MKRARIIYHEDVGSWWAESPDFPYTAVGDTLEEVQALAREGLPWAAEEPLLLEESLASAAAEVARP